MSLLAGLWTLVPVLATLPAAAQESAALNGYVRNAETGETLLQANVVVQGTSRGAATNNAGYYTIRDLPPGTYAIVFSYLGYQTRTEEVTLAAGETKRLDAELTPTDLQTNEVVVTGEQEGFTDQQVGVDKLQTATITQLPSVLTPDVFRSLALLPGVTTASDYSSNLYIRGGGPVQTLIQLDRTTVYNPTHFFGFFSTFNPDAIKDVQLYKGTYPAKYGGRLGSVVDIYNKDGNRRETTGGFTLGTLATRGYIEGPYGTRADDEPAGSYMVAVRRSTLEPLLAALDDVEGLPETFYFYDVNAKVNYDAGSDDKLSLAVYGGQDQLFLAPGAGQEFDVDYGNRTLSAEWTHLFSDQIFSTFLVAGSRYESTPVFNLGGTRFTQTNEVRDVSLKADLEYVLGDQHTVEAGLHANRLTFRLRNTFDGDETFNQRLQGVQSALYLKDTFTPSPDWTLRGGLRATYFSEGNYVRLAPRLSVKHDLTSSIQLQVAYGRYNQFLTLETSQLFTAFTWLMADEGVFPSYGDQLALGVTTRLGPTWQLEVEGYARTMHDLFERDPFLPDVAGVPYPNRFHVGDGRAYGMEVLLQRPEGRLNGFLSYSLSRTERRFPSINESEADTPQYYPPNYDRTHDLTIAVNYHLIDHWRISGTFNYATGRPYTRPEQRYELVDSPFSFNPGARGSEGVLVSPFNNARLPPYPRLDLGVARTGRFFGVAEYELQLQAINAYSRRNIWFYQYETDPGIYEPGPPFTPIVQPLTTYELSVRAPDGTTVTATTTVPDTISIVETQNKTVTYQSPEHPTFTITPPQSGRDRQAVLVLTTTSLLDFSRPQTQLRNGLTPFYEDTYDPEEDSIDTFRTTSSGVLNEANFSRDEKGRITTKLPWIAVAFYGPNESAVHVIDDNFYDLIRSQQAQSTGGQGGGLGPGEIPNVIEHVEGGTGVFASYVRATQEVFIQCPSNRDQCPTYIGQ